MLKQLIKCFITTFLMLGGILFYGLLLARMTFKLDKNIEGVSLVLDEQAVSVLHLLSSGVFGVLLVTAMIVAIVRTYRWSREITKIINIENSQLMRAKCVKMSKDENKGGNLATFNKKEENR